MDVMLVVVSLTLGATLVIALISCLKCKRRLTEEEKHKKYFEIFRRRHIKKNGTLANRVDFIRAVIMEKPVSCSSMSSIDCESEHSYEDLPPPVTPRMPVIQVTGSSPCISEHSFFDDSFQTVIEASSSVICNGNPRLSGGTCANIPTYLDLQKLQDAQSVNMSASSNLGEDNAGFSVSINSNRSVSNSRRSSCTDSGSYNVPSSCHRAEVVHPSLRCKLDLPRPVLNPDTLSLYDLPIHSPEDSVHEKYSDKLKDLWELRDHRTYNSDKKDQSCDIHKDVYILKRDNSRAKENVLSNEIDPNYEKLKISETNESVYKTLHRTKLILPGRPRALSSVTSPDLMADSTPSYKSEHTYDSITSDLAGEMNRREWTIVSEQTDFQNKPVGKILDTPANRGSYTDDSDGVTNTSHHTYDSLKTPHTPEKVEPQCVNSAIIIGRRVSNPFDKSKVAKRMINKKKQSGRDHVLKKSTTNSLDGDQRYSPFPSAKKLAFKSAFKQTASPKLCPIPTVTGKLFDNSITKTDMCLNDLNVNTPEIKVENSAHCFNNTAFLSPFGVVKNIFTDVESESPCVITPVCTYETSRNISANLKVNNLDTDIIKKQVYYRKSLGSVSESLENEIIEHCNVNIYTMSTPCVSQSQANDIF